MPQALLLIDIQNDYFPGGAMELVGATEAAQQAARLLDHFRRRQMPIIHIQHLSTRPGATFFLPGTPGAEIHPLVAPGPDEAVFTKHYPNSFRDTRLLPHLQEAGIDHLVISGMMTHMCVDTTVRAAFDLGFTCTLAHDACATRDLVFGDHRLSAAEVQVAYLAALNGLFAQVLPTAAIRAATFRDP